ncbi:rRNA biogenesis protein rrp5 [Gudongella oleilytica]|uniref:rRNA biogenesis protein rrp5 n=1 Tax=Gudongella oleilytica TaxID=1582259 RepID=UPI000FF8A397|nr:rRNA biogenesis protein rrp5 [Gudongella oleilytica]
MSKIKLLLDVVDNMRSLADSIQAAAETMAGNEPAKVAPGVPTFIEPKTTEKPVSLEHVRAALAEKSQEGFTAEVRGLLEKYGAPKLSQIDPVNYAALLADAEVLK